MSNLYNKVEKFVIDSSTKAGKTSQIKHFERTVYWLKQLKPNADEALLIAALTHDIERVFRKRDMLQKKQTAGFTSKNFLHPHEKRGAEIIGDYLEKQRARYDLINKVKTLVSKHEEGGNEDQNLLKDADSISFFENNVPEFLNRIVKEIGKEKVKKKFDWMYYRITSPKAKQIAGKLYQKAIKDLEQK